MGYEKGLVELGGKTLMQIAIENLSSVCDRILISSNSKVFVDYDFEVIPDEIPDIGPMGGIYSALKRSETEANLVLSVDLPFVNPQLFSYLIKSQDNYLAAVPYSGNDHYEPLCACYSLKLLPFIANRISIGIYKLPDLFREIAINQLTINEELDFFHPSIFFNINTPDDLISAENMINSRS